MDGIVQSRREWIRTAAGAAAVFASGVAIAQAKPISVRVVDKAQYDKIVAASKGSVVVVDCWATWCIPCRKVFPKTVEMSKKFADKGVVVMSLSFDDPVKGQVPDKVKEFLVKQNAQFENMLSSVDLSADGADVFDIPGGELPHFKIYGKDGKLFKKFEAETEFTHEQVEDAVKAALAK